MLDLFKDQPFKNPHNFYQLKENFFYYIHLPKYIYERARYGICERDTWDFDYTLSAIIAAGLRQLKDTSYSFPTELDSFEEWAEELEKMACQWEYLANGEYESEGLTYEDAARIYELKKHSAFEKLNYWFGNLWD